MRLSQRAVSTARWRSEKGQAAEGKDRYELQQSKERCKDEETDVATLARNASGGLRL